MGKILDKLLGKSSSADIAAAITKAQAELEAAEAAVVAAKTAYDDGLLTSDKKTLRVLLDDATEAGIEIDQVRAKIAKLERQHAEAIEVEAENVRQLQYEKAKDLVDAARKKLPSYEKAAMQIRDVLRAIAEADMAVELANESLPDGAARLDKAEDIRSTRQLYREDIKQEFVELWAGIGDQSTPIPDHLQHQVNPDARPRAGVATNGDIALTGRVRTDGGGVLEVVRRRFIRTKYLPDRAGWHSPSLSSTVELPSLAAGSSPLWSAVSHPPHAVLAALDKPLLPRPAMGERTPEYSYSLAPKETANV
ncbi:hypothetical protein [Shinella sp.]|uniref:hypothetical protein n=1 Tax=Shinella sp. TaxID=1870904 RepID=UPI0029B2C48B|nr:hypothetical protein [Shinella sp.]MDX3976148.1 hypothetical protein [Shinella sp.]